MVRERVMMRLGASELIALCLLSAFCAAAAAMRDQYYFVAIFSWAGTFAGLEASRRSRGANDG
jgi:hypothetical protein